MARGVKVGDAWVAVHPETQNFYHKLGKDLAAMGNDESGQPKVKVRPDVDRDKWQKDVKDGLGEEGLTVKASLEVSEREKQKLAKSLKEKPIKVGVALDQSDVARAREQLAMLGRDQHATIHVKVDKDQAVSDITLLRQLAAGAAPEVWDPKTNKYIQDAKNQLKDFDKGVGTIKLQLDRNQILRALEDVGEFQVPIQWDRAEFEQQLDDVVEAYNQRFADAWLIHAELDQADAAEIEAQLKRWAKDETKTIRVRYLDDQSKGQKARRDRLHDMLDGKAREVHVTYTPDDTALAAQLDQNYTVTVRPVLDVTSSKRVDKKLNELTRPRIVEIISGDTSLHGFDEDVAQVLQSAWDDLDLDLDVEINTKLRSDLDKLAASMDKLATRTPDDDFVQKVFVVNQPTTGTANPAAGTNLADVVDELADVVRDPFPRERLGVSDATARAGRSTIDYDEVAEAVRRGTRASGALDDGDNDDLLRLQIRSERAQAERYWRQALAMESRNNGLPKLIEHIEKVQANGVDSEAFRASMDELAQQVRARAGLEQVNGNLRRLDRLFRQQSGVFSTASNARVDASVKQATWRHDLDTRLDLSRVMVTDIPDALASIERTRAKWDMAAEGALRQSAAYEKRAQRLEDQLADTSRVARARRPLTAERDITARQVALNAEAEEAFTRLSDSLAHQREELQRNTRALTFTEQTVHRLNVERLAKDPNAETISVADYERELRRRKWRVGFDHDVADWDKVTGKGAFSKAVESMTAPNGRDGRLMFFAKNMAHSLAKPVGVLGDLGLQTTGALMRGSRVATDSVLDLSKLGMGGITDGVKAAGINLGDVKGEASQLGSIDELTGKLGKLGATASKVLGPVSAVGGAFLKIYGATLKTGTIGALAGGITQVVSGLGAMSSSVLAPVVDTLKGIAFAPAMFTSLAASVGASVVAFQNLGSAFTDEEAFAKLTDSAKDFVTQTKELAPAWKEVQQATQESFFQHWGEDMEKLGNHTLPMLKEELPYVAGAVGALGDQLITSLGRKDVADDFARAFKATADGLHDMRPGIDSLTTFLGKASAMGAEKIMPALGEGFSNLMESFNKWADNGGMESWMDSAIDGFGKLKDFVGTTASGLGEFFSAAKKGADSAFGEGGVWGAMMDKLEQFQNWAGSAEGQDKLSGFFATATEDAKEIGSIIGEWGSKIVTETGPAFHEFIGENGDKLKNIGNDIVDIMTNTISSLGPTISMIEPVIDKVAKAAELANELVGGAGSERAKNEIKNKTKGAKDYAGKMWNDQDVGNWAWHNWADERWEVGSEDNIEQQKRTAEKFIDLQNRIRDNANAGVEAPDLTAAVEQATNLDLLYRKLSGGFEGATQSAEATSAALGAIGDKLVAIPDKKSLVIEDEGTEDVQEALEKIGADVSDPMNGEVTVTFPNEMDLQGALENIRSQVTEMPEAEIRARGLNEVLGQLETLAGNSYEATIDVDASNVDAAVGKLQEVGVAAENIHGEVTIDLNDGGTRDYLMEIGAGGYDAHGTFTLDSNAGEILAEAAGLEGFNADGNFHMDSNADQVASDVINIPSQTSGQHTVSDNAGEVNANVEGITKSTSGEHKVSDNVAAITSSIQSLNNQNTSSTHTIIEKIQKVVTYANIGKRWLSEKMTNADGSVRPRKMADGGAEREAMIAPGGSWITWAENETEGESYIPWAPQKRARSTQILAATAEGFGYNLVDRDGNPVGRNDGVHVGWNGRRMANGGMRETPAQRSERLRKLNKELATQRAKEKVAQKAKSKTKKKTVPASPALIRQYNDTMARGENIDKLDEGVARKLVGFKNGQFVYADAKTDDDDVVMAMDRTGLIPTRVGMRNYLERNDDLDFRTQQWLAATEAGDRMTPEQREQYMQLPVEVRREIEKRRDLPEYVKRAMLKGERLEDPNAPVDVDKVMASKNWRRAALHVMADPKNPTQWDEAGGMVSGELGKLGRAVGDSYTSEFADMIGLNFTKAEDSPLYRMFNPTTDYYNTLISDFSRGRRELEGDYRDKYRDERNAYRDADKAERERQQAADKAKQRAELFGDSAKLKDAIVKQDEKNNEQLARYNAGMDAVRAHRSTAAAQQAASRGQGVVVNQRISNITTNNAQDAADRFRRQAMVGFENLAGRI